MIRQWQPLVTILMPARNAAGTIAPCLRSISRQVYRRWECLVVDDGSADGTSDIVLTFSRTDERYRLLRPGRVGLVGALSHGLACTAGELVARMDADDLMHRQRLEMQVDAFRRDASLDLLGTHVRFFPRRDLRKGTLQYEYWLNSIVSPEVVRAECLVECPLAHPSIMARTGLLQDFGYRDRGWPEDYDLVLRLLESGKKLAVVPERLHLWRRGERRHSMLDKRYGIDRFQECKVHFLCRGILAGISSYSLWGFGGTGRTLRKFLERRGKVATTIVDMHPGRLGQFIHGAVVVPPEKVDRATHAPMIVSVAGVGPRTEVRRFLKGRGFRELVDFVCTA